MKPYPKHPIKTASKKSVEKELWKWFSIYIRLRDSDENGYCKCITCGVTKKWNEGMQCGHGIPRQHWGTRYDEKNNHAQCAKCNGPEGGEQVKYREAVNKKYGPDTWDKLLFAKKNGKKPSEPQVVLMLKHYRHEAKEMLRQKGIGL